MSEKIIVSELIKDYDIYPRASIDATHVQDLIDAELAGAKLPPIIADRKSKRIVDGFHRVRKHEKLYGEDAKISVIFKDYENEQALYLDAIKLNSDVKKKISGADRTHAVIVGVNLGIKDTALADAFGVTVERVQQIIEIKTGIVKSPQTKNKAAKQRVVRLKNSVRHDWGKHREYTPEQATWIDKHAPGQNQTTLINQLVELIELDLLDKNNAAVMSGLARLRSLLSDVVEIPA
jgi:hypothetical protein